MGYEKSEKTKKKLRDAMSHLLRVQGYHATGIQQILKESGTPKGSLYYHFPEGKVELAARSVEQSAAEMACFFQELTEDTHSWQEALNRTWDYYIDKLTGSNYTLGSPIATITLEAAATNDPIQKACDKGFALLMSIIKGILLRHGMEQQTASEMATLVFSSLEGALILCKAQRSTKPLEYIRPYLLQQISEIIPEQ